MFVDLRREPIPRTPGEDKSLQETQILPGEKIKVLEKKDGWFYVEALDQPFYSTEWYGYRGWVQELPSHTPYTYPSDPLAWLDVPYVWGGLSYNGIDCSGFIHLLYRSQGKIIPRNASHQYLSCDPIESPEPGDLAFFKTNEKIDHVTLYLGKGQFIEATESAGRVRLTSQESAIYGRVTDYGEAGTTFYSERAGGDREDHARRYADE